MADDLADLPVWGGVYAASRAARDAEPDTAREVVEKRVRESARKAGHEPVGAVRLRWYDYDPENPPEDRSDPPADPQGRVWAKAVVRIRPGGAAKADVRNCRHCGTEQVVTGVRQENGPPVIVVHCPRCDT